MTEPEKRGPGRPPKFKTDDQEDRRGLEQILSELDTNATVKVHRTDPEWASGYCGQFYIAQGKNLTTEEIKNRFGGRVLQLTIHGPNGKYVKRQTIVIDDIPRREGQPVQRDGTLMDTSGKKGDHRTHPLEQIFGLGLPPHLTRQISNYYLGADYQSDEKQHSNGFSDMFGAVQMQKMMMDMMNQSNTAQMQMMQSQFEMQKSIMNARRDFEESAKPKDPLGDVNNIIRVVRELNGIKSELGGAPEGLTGQILENTMPMVETLLTEYMSYMKLKAQAELQRPVQNNVLPPPALPQRQVDNVSKQIAEKHGSESKPNPGELARHMAQMYVGLSPVEKQAVNLEFLKALNETSPDNVDTMENNVDHMENCDNMEQDTINTEYLDQSDLELLTNGGVDNNQNASGDIQNSEHTGTAKKDDTPYREGNS